MAKCGTSWKSDHIYIYSNAYQSIHFIALLSLIEDNKKNMVRREESSLSSSLKHPLISPCEEKGDSRINNSNNGEVDDGRKRRKEKITDEVKTQLWLSGPLVLVSLLQYSLQMISVMFVGHLGELKLSGASMASSFASVTGFSLLVSFAFISNTVYDLSLFYLGYT